MQASFNQHSVILWAALLALVLLIAIWVAVVHTRSRRLEARIDELLGAVDAGNVGQMLVEYLGTVRTVAGAVEQLQADHERIARLIPGTIRHVGLVRFSPFHDTGGDQSFTLAVLDGRRDGIVLTGLHSRTDSRLYAKPVRAGDSDYVLIPEEREAITQAVSGNRASAPN